MRALIIAAGLLAVGATAATAQYGGGPRGYGPPPAPPGPPVWTRQHHPYEQRHHGFCHRKAWELRHYEQYAQADGRYTKGERRITEQLRHDLQRTCGGYRWRG